ncbi:CorA metal ion transporter [Coemansia sp. RSA 1813]|nr:CorA metal ion transporter [Coemansia sp. RSA 1646]KAJ1771297.1 CorA metal ion transporter [Coemansia sp. RSA 1843]KAJ2088951.1 CorA metal ion transporter [Coemansia sp. RSA 986]KAJ2213242.1 CorA metal ion transporter [Coemansia sp. RSA 487]KAJ2569508.1 CorA metal ion transporter [Coemansia sp. RSA 1813]
MVRAQSADNAPLPFTRQQQQMPATVATAGSLPRTGVDLDALKQWSGTGKLKRSHTPSHHRKYRLGRWQSRSASSWNPPGSTPISPLEGSGSAREASRSRRSLVSIDISHKPSESRRTSIASIHRPSRSRRTSIASIHSTPPLHLHDIDDLFDYEEDSDSDGDLNGPLAQLLLKENDEIWNNQAFRFTFYSPRTGTVRATDVQTLRTDEASGLDALIRQALDDADDSKRSSSHADNDAEEAPGLAARVVGDGMSDRSSDMGGLGAASSRSGGHVPVPYAIPPQLSITSADSITEATSPGDQVAPSRAPGNDFLHPNYTRTQFGHRKGRADTSSSQHSLDDDAGGPSSPFPKLPDLSDENDSSTSSRSPGAGGGPESCPKVFWLDIMNPADGEITALSRIFNFHPLTTEELLLMRENGLSQDNYKSFRHYDVICYRTSMGTQQPPERPAGASTANVAMDTDPVSRDSGEIMYDQGDAYGSHVRNRHAQKGPAKRKSFVRDIAHRVQPSWDSAAKSQGLAVETHDIVEDQGEKMSGGEVASSSTAGSSSQSTRPRGMLPWLGLRNLASLVSRRSKTKQAATDDANLHTTRYTLQNQAALQQDFPGSFGDEALDEPAPLYVIVLADGIITLHYHSVPHVRNTVARLKLDEDLVQITPDYIAYLLLDDITDTLVPTTRLLELEVDAIDELVLILTRAEHDDVLKRIGIERRHALWLVRLMHGKAEVLRAIERRVQSKMGLDTVIPAISPRSVGKRRMRSTPRASAEDVEAEGTIPRRSGSMPGLRVEYADKDTDSDTDAVESQLLTSDEEEGDLYEWARKTDDAPRYNAPPKDGSDKRQLVPDVTKYLADVHDHLIALTASVHHCERILARAHGNYLARINLELTHASNTTNQLATQMTVLAGIFLPLNLVAGIFGMNVKVPGRDRDDLRDFGLILAGMAVFVIVALAVCRWRRII